MVAESETFNLAVDTRMPKSVRSLRSPVTSMSSIRFHVTPMDAIGGEGS